MDRSEMRRPGKSRHAARAMAMGWVVVAIFGLMGCNGSMISGADEPSLPEQTPSPRFAEPGPNDIRLDARAFTALFGHRPEAVDPAGKPQPFALLGTELDILGNYAPRLDRSEQQALDRKIGDCRIGFLVQQVCRLVPVPAG